MSTQPASIWVDAILNNFSGSSYNYENRTFEIPYGLRGDRFRTYRIHPTSHVTGDWIVERLYDDGGRLVLPANLCFMHWHVFYGFVSTTLTKVAPGGCSQPLYVNTEPDGHKFNVLSEDLSSEIPPSAKGVNRMQIPRLASGKNYEISGPVRFGVVSGAAIPNLLLRYTPHDHREPK